MTQKKEFGKQTLNKWKLNGFFLKKMPLGLITGIRVVRFDQNRVVVSMPYNYITQNPFQSMHFAAQSMAAELSSGVIAINEIAKAPAPVSMLVLNMDARFTKKAKTKILFTCNETKTIAQAIQSTLESGEAKTVTIPVTGMDKEGDMVSEFHFTWTFKVKKLKKDYDGTKKKL